MGEEIVSQISSERDVVIVTFNRPSVSDADDISATAEHIGRFLDAERPRYVIFDFQAVKFFSSQVLGLLLETRSRVSAHEGQVFITSINPQLHRVFKITNLDRVFKFFPDKDAALKAAKSG